MQGAYVRAQKLEVFLNAKKKKTKNYLETKYLNLVYKIPNRKKKKKS